MKRKKYIWNSIVLLIVCCNIGCDQISKTIVRRELGYDEVIRLLNDHFTITKVENTGAFLSLGNSLPFYIKFILLSLIPIMMLLLGLYFLMSKSSISKTLAVGLCFIIGGGAGNLFDRLIYGSVTDFLHIDFGLFETGIFNMADVSISIGFIVILADLYLKRKSSKITNSNA